MPNFPLAASAPKPAPFAAWQGALLAVGYVLSGKLGLLLAMPPGYATGIFPAAGLAIAASYVWGRRALPWVALGAFLLNVWVGAAAPSWTRGLLVSFGIAVASTLQAGLGGRWLRRALGRDAELDSGRQIAAYLLLAPPICLVSSTLSALWLVAWGMVPVSRFFVSWVMWGVGDALGVIAMFPVLLALFGRPQPRWRKRRWFVIAPMLGAFALVVLVYVGFGRMETEKNARDFAFQAERSVEMVQDGFVEQEHVLDHLDAVLSHHRESALPRRDFGEITGMIHRHYPMLQAIEWIPRVPAREREDFERKVRKEVPDFAIRERDSRGHMVPSRPRDEYYPVTYVEPFVGNETAMGFDLGSHPTRRMALLAAQWSDRSVASDPVKLVQGNGGQWGILLVRRITAGANAPGFLLSVVRVEEFLRRVLASRHGDVELHLRDIRTGVVLHDDSACGAPGLVRILMLGERPFRLEVRPSESFLAERAVLHGWWLLVAGFLATGLFGGILLLVSGTTQRIQDVVEQRTRALDAESAKNRKLLQAASDGVHILDLEGNLLEWSDSFARMLGYGPEEMDGMNVLDWEATIPPDLLLGRLQRFVREAATFESLHRRKDGTIVDVEINAKGIEIGGVVHLYASSRDISERKRTQAAMAEAMRKAEAADRAKGQFLANMSHEIRTPMNAVLGIVQLLERTDLDASQRGMVDQLEGASRSLLDILNDILDYSKIEAGRLDLEWVEFGLADLVDDLATIMAYNGKTKDLELAIRIEPEVPRRLKGDPTRLKQILVNLAGNAIKFTEAGRVDVSIEAVSSREGTVWLDFAVRDTGIGMSSEQIARLFRVFTQGDESMTRRYGGTGLGLVISKRLVERMGGVLRVESEPGRGSAFSFRIPLETCPGEDGPDRRESAESPRVRIVAGDPETRRALLTIVERLGWRSAPDGSPVDLALLDSKSAVAGAAGEAATVVRLVSACEQGREASGEGGKGTHETLVKPISEKALESLVDRLSRAPTGEPTSSSGTMPRRLVGVRILVAEDNRVNQMIVRRLLEMEGAVVETVVDGARAVERVAEASDNFDIVLMDAQMPVMDGFEATRRIRGEHRILHLPIVALSAGVTVSERERCIEAGMDDFLSKPIDLGEVVRVVRERVPAGPDS